MICKNCGGVLDFVNGHYECQSCGNVLHPEIVIQHFDVCICCIENDESYAGRGNCRVRLCGHYADAHAVCGE